MINEHDLLITTSKLRNVERKFQPVDALKVSLNEESP